MSAVPQWLGVCLDSRRSGTALRPTASGDCFPSTGSCFNTFRPLQVLAHRIVWSFVALALVTAAMLRRRTGSRRDVSAERDRALRDRRAADRRQLVLLRVGRQPGFVVETSLGYFITPLVNVLLGVVVFRERLRAPQWVAVALAAAGVLLPHRGYGVVPWIAIGLAITFGSYGLAKKKATLGPLEGLTLETAMLVRASGGLLDGASPQRCGRLHANRSGDRPVARRRRSPHHRAAALVRVSGSARAALDCRHPAVHCADDSTRPRCPGVPRAVHARSS